MRLSISKLARLTRPITVALILIAVAAGTHAHPLGNFTINHFTRIQPDAERLRLHYVIDMAEIPAFQTMQGMQKNIDGTVSHASLNSYLDTIAPQYVGRLFLTVDGERVPLRIVAKNISAPSGTGGLPTLRLEFDCEVELSNHNAIGVVHFEDTNNSERIGWREIVVQTTPNTQVFNSTAFGSSASDDLKSYPQDLLTAPLNERAAEFSFTAQRMPAGATPLRLRDGRPVMASRDRLADLIAVPRLTPGLVLLGLVFAVMLGAVHALSPGHGKTVVGAYLVGSRGTVRHAAFLGLTVTITHTAGVFALGVITLLASEYVVPERLYPWLSLLSGAMVVAIGVTLLARRIFVAFRSRSHEQLHSNDHSHGHHHAGTDPTKPHSHGGRTHSHLPPGADGAHVTWKSLLALGISGGILPCPSALVVLLAAISLHRVAYGLLLVMAFSAGLAGVLTAVGMAFVYAGRLLKSSRNLGRLSSVLPVASAFVITCAGLIICYEALSQFVLPTAIGVTLSETYAAIASPSFASIGSFGLLGLGLVYGLKHATEADHIVAVSTIVSEHKKLGRAALVGGLWGAGHTASLVIVGALVLALKVAIPERVAGWLEFVVALMIIVLGILAFRRAIKGRADIHTHAHQHGLFSHSHLHFHEASEDGAVVKHSHKVARIGVKPAIVGAIHGLAGSAALTLLVLTQINSPLLGLLYLAVFGVGSILGMLLMSGLVGLPFVFGSHLLGNVSYRMQMLAGVLSILFGVWYAYQTLT